MRGRERDFETVRPMGRPPVLENSIDVRALIEREDVRKLDAIAMRQRATGDNQASRARLIRQAVEEWLARQEAE